MAEEIKHGKMTNAKKGDPPNIIMIYTAYQLYLMINRTCIGTDDHLDSYLLSTTQKKIWEVPMLKIYKTALENNVINSDLESLSLNDLYKSIKDKAKINPRRTTTDDKDTIWCIKVIYYNIVFCPQFKQHVFATFNPEQLDPKIIHLSIDKTTTAKVTQGIVKWHQNKCIECKATLSISFRSNQEDAQGQIAMVYHNTDKPKICCNYRMRCQQCDITYGYNRIDYEKKGEKKTLFLDPSAFPYFAACQRSRNFIHQSILKAITDRQYSNKPQGIETWCNYYNLDRKDVYDELRKMIPADKKETIEVELGYKTILQSFYLYSALQRLCKIKDFGTIKINDRDVKVALILKDDDTEKIKQRENIISECKVNENSNKINFRENHAIFRFIIQEYGKEMLNADMTYFQSVPIKLAKHKNGTMILIYPGWFVIYGDGNEKLFRARCAYPAICAKYDYMKKAAQTDANEIGNDDGVDLSHNNNAAKYSAQRYYECDNTPALNDTNNKKLSYKTCKYHTHKLNKEYGIDLHDISKFTTFYRIHAALAGIEKESILKSINTTYTVDEQILNSITSKQKKRHENLKNQLVKEFSPHEISKFQKYFKGIYDKVNAFTKDRPPREAAIIANARIIEHNACDKQAEISEKIHEMLGKDDDGEIISDYYAVTAQAQDMLDAEFKNNEYLDKVKGCRKSKNITPATACTTKGLNVWMNAAGLVLNLREEIVRETPTAVILDVADILMRNETMKKYSQYIEAIGYDMMCRIYHHLKNINDRLDKKAEKLWNHLIYRAFIDAWHIYTHTDDLCKKGGVFHPKSEKFENILFFKDHPDVKILFKRINDIVAEQFWAIMNGSKHIRSMAKETTFMFLLDKILYHNDKKISDIKKEGWTFVPIDYFEPLQQADSNKNKTPSPKELNQKLSTSLQKVRVKSSCRQTVIDLVRSSTQTAVQNDNQLPPQINSPNIDKKRRYKKRKGKKRKMLDTESDTQSPQPSKKRKTTAETAKSCE